MAVIVVAGGLWGGELGEINTVKFFVQNQPFQILNTKFFIRGKKYKRRRGSTCDRGRRIGEEDEERRCVGKETEEW